MKLSDLTPAPYNPRDITAEALSGLKASLGDFGDLSGITWNSRTGHLVCGHQRLRALQEQHGDELRMVRGSIHTPTGEQFKVREVDWPEEKERAANIAANSPLISGSFTGQLEDILASLEQDYSEMFAPLRLDEMLGELQPPVPLVDDEVPDLPKTPITKPGDLWVLGDHRLLCGDTTDPENIARLMSGSSASMVHADPPYGMGKEKDGILNDNLYREKLDKFQMKWWKTWLPAIRENASAYIWGTAEDLWRLWYCGGLNEDPGLMVRNEIVWDKSSAIGKRSPGQHSFPVGTERCLFLMRGQQFLGNQNIEDYWEGYEPFRLWLVGERDRAGWSNTDVNRLTGTHMAGHWFTKSQFQIMRREVYENLQRLAGGSAFTASYDGLLAEHFPDIRNDGNTHRRELSAAIREKRTTFDNTHAAMTDVWDFGIVHGAERHGHATPKPVEMAGRAIRSSSKPDDCIAVPFCGTCPEIIAAEQLNRRCFGIEIDPGYCDVIVERWENLTGGKATR